MSNDCGYYDALRRCFADTGVAAAAADCGAGHDAGASGRRFVSGPSYERPGRPCHNWHNRRP